MADAEEISRWETKAENDFTAARDLLKISSSSTDAICFHCQQAVEKYLKAMLINCGKKFQKTHDLLLLAEMLCSKYPELKNFREDFSRLTLYAVDIRYPDDNYMPGIDESKKALECVISVKKIFNSAIKKADKKWR